MRYQMLAVSFLAVSLQGCLPIQLQSAPQPSPSPSPSPTVSAVPTLPPLATVPLTAVTPVKALVVQPAVIELSVGQEKALENVVLVQEDNTVTVLKKLDLLTLAVSNTRLAEVTPARMVKALKEGETTVTVQLGALSQMLVLKVSAAKPSATAAPVSVATPLPVLVTSPTPSPTPVATSAYKSLGTDQSTYRLKVGESLQVILSVELQSGDIGLINDRTKADWQSAISSVATISPSGMIAARATGTTTMTVNYGGLSRTFSVIVTAS